MRSFALSLLALNAIGVVAFAQANPTVHENQDTHSHVRRDKTGAIYFDNSFVAGIPQLSPLTLHQLSPDEAKNLPYSTYYKNEEDTCSVMLYDDGSILVRSMTSYSEGQWLFERWHIFHDAAGIHAERELEVFDGQNLVTATGGQPLFSRLCSKVANHNLPGKVRIKFFRMLGVY